MKIKLSKSQWEFIGKKTGWMKTAQEDFFETHNIDDLEEFGQQESFEDSRAEMKSALENDLDLLPENDTTNRSLENMKKNLKYRGRPVSIVLQYFPNWPTTYRVTAFWRGKGSHVFQGLGWGYKGEGPHGLAEMFKMCGVPISIDEIASWPRNEGFRKTIDVSAFNRAF